MFIGFFLAFSFTGMIKANPLLEEPPQSVARLGWDSGNAGDGFVAEFVATARDIKARLPLLPPALSEKFDGVLLSAAINSARVNSEEFLSLRGIEVSAINRPWDNSISISRNHWKRFRGSENVRARSILVLHEYLGLIGADDKGYALSSLLISFMYLDQGLGANTLVVNPVNIATISMASTFPPGCRLSRSQVSFDLRMPSEIKEVSLLDCPDRTHRTIRIQKSFEEQTVGDRTFQVHFYSIKVFNEFGLLLSELQIEPEWVRCVNPSVSGCRSGAITVAGFRFELYMSN